MKASLLLVSALSLLAAVGCGPEFDPGNELKTLRVLGVKKDKPYALPGEEVNLSLLWHDAKGPRPVQRAFIGGCINPPGDLYYGCFAQYGQAAQNGEPPALGAGDTFKVKLPRDIISSRGNPEPGQPRYGLYIVFFAVCAGTLSFDMDASASYEGSAGLPIRCLDDAGQPLGSEDFIVGYSSIYSFEDATNTNPSFSLNADGKATYEVEGKELVADCVGESCQDFPAVDVDCAAEPARCIKACADDGDSECPAIDVKPSIDPSVVEKDDVSSRLFKSDVTEQMWVSYYLDRGGINEARLLNDTTSGWNPKYRGQLRAPKDPGPLQLWSVIHDNRGGMEFSRITLKVE